MRFVLILWLALACAVPAFAQSGGQIVVTGEGRFSVAPDMARLSIGVTHEARTAAEAIALVAQDTKALLASFESAGINESDTQTSALSVNPVRSNRDQANGGTGISGFVASNILSVTVRDLDGLGGVIDAAMSAGANRLNGLNFDVADRTPGEDAARRGAVADAMRRAQVIAEAAGLMLGSIQEIREGGAGAPRPQMMAEMSMARAADMQIAPGELTFSANVMITYSLQPAN